MDRELLVYIDLNNKPLLVGRLWTRLRKGKESATFEYDKQSARRVGRGYIGL
jgi:serine/threonine-protein kinase HipA